MNGPVNVNGNVIAFAGTGTDVGKTFVAAALIERLRATGSTVLVRKPVQSFAPGDTATDAEVLARAAGVTPTEVCPEHRWIPLPMAPPMAAEALGLPSFTVADLTDEVLANFPDRMPLIVETAGGVRSPIATDGDVADFVRALEPALVVLVADAGLGTINVVRLSRDALWKERLVVVYLNRFDARSDLHVRNRDWLVQRENLVVVTGLDGLVKLVEPICR